MKYFSVFNNESSLIGIIQYNKHTRPTMAALAELIRDEWGDYIQFLPNVDFTKISYGNSLAVDVTLNHGKNRLSNDDCKTMQAILICEVCLYTIPFANNFDYSGFTLTDESAVSELLDNLAWDWQQATFDRDANDISFAQYCTDGVDSNFKFIVQPSTISHPPKGQNLEDWIKQND